MTDHLSLSGVSRMTPTDALRHEFGKGFAAGVVETLDQLEGRSRIAPAGGYRGPVPDELLTWLSATRKRVEALDG